MELRFLLIGGLLAGLGVGCRAGTIGEGGTATCLPVCQEGQHCDTSTHTCVCDNPCTVAGSFCDPSGSGKIGHCTTDAVTGCFTLDPFVDCATPGEICVVGAGACAIPGATLKVVTTSLANGMVTRSYAQLLGASGGAAPFIWSIASGTLPDGLSLPQGTDAITGVPTTVGTNNFTVEVTDSVLTTQTQALSITVSANLAVSTTTLPDGRVGLAYSQLLEASGGTLPYEWSVISEALPPGIAYAPDTGVVSGTPTTAGTNSFTVQVADSDGFTATQVLSLAVAANPVLAVSTSSLNSGTTGVAYDDNLTATGGTPPYNWTVIVDTLPDGLELTSSGNISGTPTTAGMRGFTVQVEDANEDTATKMLSITIADGQAQNTYYVSPTTATPAGNDGNSGTISSPWATLSHAISAVSTVGSIIYVNAGTYPAITTQMLLAVGVSIEGAGRTSVTIPMTYSAGEPCIKMESYGAWSNKTVGYQHISGIKFVGSTTLGSPVGRVGIGVNFRHHVEIHDCEFVDFVYSAVTFQGEPTYSLDDDVGTRIDNPYETRAVESAYLPYPDSFCEGNKFYNNIVHNSCGVKAGNDFSGELEFSMQDGFLVYGNTMTALGRAGTGNGVPIKMIIGFNRNTKIYDNDINAGHKDTNYWQFGIEIWWDLGGLEIHDNTINGSIDLCNSWDQYGTGYGARIYDNDIGYSATTTNLDVGIVLESSHLDTYIFRNKIHHVSKGIGINNNPYSTTTENNGLYIYDNLMVELSGQQWQTWGIYYDLEVSNPGVIWRNIYIQHNTIVAKSSAPDPTYYGIMLPTVQRFDGFFVENNILVNWERGAVWASGSRVQATNFFIRNNLIYDSYNSNDPVYLDGYPTAGITYVVGPKADPLFEGGSPYSYELSSTSSPAYHMGRDLDIATDYAGNAFHETTPSIGAYEKL